MIDTTKLEQITRLEKGAHEKGAAMCAMEAVAWLAGEPWSDAPKCASPVIAQFMRSWNDALPDADRTRLLLPLLPDVIETRTTAADEETRAWMAVDWLVRECTPSWCDVVPSLARHAAVLRELPVLSPHTMQLASPVLNSARVAAGDAAWDAAWDAAGGAARDAAWDAVGDAAGVAARAAAWTATRNAAGAAAWAAARAAAMNTARDALAPTVATLQASAQELVRRMCAVGRTAKENA